MWPNPQFPVDLAQKNSLMENLITEEFLNGKLPFFVQLSFIDDQVILKKKFRNNFRKQDRAFIFSSNILIFYIHF